MQNHVARRGYTPGMTAHMAAEMRPKKNIVSMICESGSRRPKPGEPRSMPSMSKLKSANPCRGDANRGEDPQCTHSNFIGMALPSSRIRA